MLPGFGTLRRVALVLFLIGIVVVAALSLAPAQALPALDVSDKAEHAAAYAVLAFLGTVAVPRPHRLLVIGLALLGLALELGQLRVPGRSFDLLDAVANVVGAATGAILARLLLAALSRSRPRSA